jgi:EAL domain-containing protein (putative c-di-GMP-specific phosphodiesterase class I)
MAVLMHAVVIAALSALANLAMVPALWLPLLWPAGGMGFSLLLTRGHNAIWSLSLGVMTWSALTHPEALFMAPVVAAATGLGQWLAWKRLQVRFAGTSQPFARMITVIAFLRVQGLLAAPVSSLVVTVGWALWQPPTPWLRLAWMWGAHWVLFLASTVLVAPLTWEWLIARTRGGRQRFFEKALEAFRADWRTLSAIVLLSLTAGVYWTWQLPVQARTAIILMLPFLVWDATRAGSLTIHLMTLLTGILALTVARFTMPVVDVPAVVRATELSWLVLAVAMGIMAVQVLQVTAHERRLALRRLERQADTDPLTNLLSLSGLYRKFEEMGDRVDDASDTQFSHFGDGSPSRAPTLVSVQMTNADSMEQLLGSKQSDMVERSTSGALTQAASKVLWARVSKAHFVGLLPGGSDELDTLLTQLNFAVLETRALVDESVGRPIWTVAAVTIESDPSPPIEVVMACLRQAEQMAQDSRQIQVLPVNHESAQALKLEAEQAERIRLIIQQKKLVLYAQPIVANVDPRSLKHKYEVLIRLRDDAGQIIPPGAFLPVAMRAGLMQLLDMAVMEQTFQWFAAHPKALEALSHCAINLSGPTVASPTVAQRIADGLRMHKLPAHKFTFEITESQAIANPGQATDTIRAIRECGCRVAIDDFGTGVATFDYLKRFDVDYIKIDGAFIKSLLNEPVDRVIVESMVKVAHQLKVRTVAEFVSSPALHQAVTALGVDESQGFVFGQPKPLHEWFDEDR